MDENPKQQIAEKIQDANNVLVTVSNNPSVDQLAACIGLTLLINKLGKHGSAVFSGKIPSTIEFLEPEKTLEANTNSLRDFIIALDKSKADKLRYKVEDRIVKIFITPYRTSLTQDDLDFSQGDFNVDVVIALGVHEREELDQAITAHGRILHDATVISVNNREHSGLGTVNWVDTDASSLSEMVVALAKGISKEPIDSQMATAFMTGIVAETERFSNDKTSPRTMNIASELMSAGANQRLIATKLEGFQPIPQVESPPTPQQGNTEEDVERKRQQEADKASHDGALRITHDADDEPSQRYDDSLAQLTQQLPPAPSEPSSRHQERVIQPPPLPKPLPPLPPIDDVKPSDTSATRLQGTPSMVMQPPMMGGQLTANTQPEHTYLGPSANPLSLPPVNGSNNAYLGQPQQLPPSPLPPPPPQAPLPPTQLAPMPPPASVQAVPPPPPPPPPPAPAPPQNQPGPSAPTLASLEQTVGRTTPAQAPPQAPFNPPDASQPAPHVETVEEAREAVDEAIRAAGDDERLEPIAALGAQPLGESLHPSPAQEPAPNPFAPPGQSLPTEPFAMPEAVVAPQQPAPSQNDNNGSDQDSFMNPSPLQIVVPTSQTQPAGIGSPPPPVPPPMMPPLPGNGAASDDRNYQPPVL